MKKTTILLLLTFIFSESWENHPEINWLTIESDHFLVHYYKETERTAFKVVDIAEFVYTPITDLYNYHPTNKTHIIRGVLLLTSRKLVTRMCP